MLLIVVLGYRCLHGSAPSYLTEGLRCMADVDSQWRLRSASTFCTHCSYNTSCRWWMCLLCGCCKDLEQPVIWSHAGIIFVHDQAPAQDITFYQKLSRQLPPHTTNHFHPVPQIPSFYLTLLGVLTVILTLRHLNFSLMNEWTVDNYIT